MNIDIHFNLKTKIILLLVCITTIVFCSFKFFECLNIQKALNSNTEYNQTWLKISDNLDKEKRSNFSNYLNNNLNLTYGENVLVSIPTNNKMVVYSIFKTESNNIIDMIKSLSSSQINFRTNKNGEKWHPTNFSIEDIKEANVTTSQGYWAIELKLTKKGTKKFADLTKSIIGEHLGIFHDNILLTAPIVREEIKSGTILISNDGGISNNEALNIVSSINSSNLSYKTISVDRFNILTLCASIILIITALSILVLLTISTIQGFLNKFKCKKCGYTNKIGQKFCSKCGEKLK
ncbi:zinc-ribbon domain-containing protein [bacterium]|nr:zinc-ribbon domain-containing protein [bacterium]